MIWICKLCEREEHVHKTTDGELFVFHHCRLFGGAVAPGQGKNVRKYVTNLPGFFQNDSEDVAPINVSVFPLRDTM